MSGRLFAYERTVHEGGRIARRGVTHHELKQTLVRTGGLILGFSLAICAYAQPQGSAGHLTQAPTLDGNIRGDPAWAELVPLSGFTQVQPSEGLAASEQTDVFVGFTQDMLYVGIVCYDTNPDRIIVSNSRRDADLSMEDSIQFVIDPYQGEQDGFLFGTNAAGIEFDAQLKSTQTARFRETGFDQNWDAVWDVATHRGAFGWSAEFAIPFKSLRYGSGRLQDWNFNFQRIIRHKNEIAYWSPIPVQFSLNRLSLAGEVTGIEVPSLRNLKLTPYVLGKTARGGMAEAEEDDSEFGVDVKYSLTSSLTLDLTYNTDFAQVEVDEQQVNLDRFSLFFPEKRPFFLENAGQFSVGVPGQTELFFSRRIGIGPGGEQLPIDGGVRLSGKIGDSTNIGLLHMRSEAVRGVAPVTDFSVLRIKEEFENRSSVGLMMVNKDSDLGDNQTYALDGQLGVGEKTLISGFVAKTETNGIKDDDHAFRVSAGRDGESWTFNGAYEEVGDRFNPEVGFLARRGYRNVTLFGSRRIRFGQQSRFLEMVPHVNYQGYWDFEGYYESGRVHLDHSMIWKNGGQIHAAVNFTHEGVKQPFEIARGVIVDAGEYDHEELSVFSWTDSSDPLNVGMNFVYGGFFGGDRFSASPFINYRIGETFSARFSLNHNDVKLPNGDFKVNLSQLRLSYSFTPKISIQAFVQHNDRDDLLATNLRFSWLQSANSGLFIVYNETDDDRRSPGRPRREFIIKYSHIFDV